jgi:hypothetical protein
LVKKLYPEDPNPVIKVEFLAEGAFNRVYAVDVTTTSKSMAEIRKNGTVELSRSLKYVFRVSLPVDPHMKTSSEVAIIQYPNECTSRPAHRMCLWMYTSQSTGLTEKFGVLVLVEQSH